MSCSRSHRLYELGQGQGTGVHLSDATDLEVVVVVTDISFL